MYIADQNNMPKIPKEKFVFVQQGTAIKDENFETKPIGFFKDAMMRFCKNKASVSAMVINLFIIFLSIFGPSFNSYGFNDQDVNRINLPPRIPVLENIGIADGTRVLTNRRVDNLDDPEKYPEGSIVEILNRRTEKNVEMCDVKINYYVYTGYDDEYFWAGTDYLGRDLWTRLCRGSRVSLMIATLAVFANILIGIIYGAIAGYYGGKVDMVMMRICEIIGAFPQVVVATLFIMFFGTGIFSIVMALIIRGWISTARLIRAQFLRFKSREYVLAARTLGVRDRALIFRHILPNSIGPIITKAMIEVPNAIFSESFLAFIGLGLQAPEPSIGVLLSDGQKVLLHYPYQTLFPALLISILMISFNLFSNGLRDAFDPTMRGID